MRKIIDIPWITLLVLAVGSVSVAWALAAGSTVPLFNSPPPHRPLAGYKFK